MQNNRRQFLGSLARGLLLPIGGGAVALAEPAKAAALQITQGPLPLSADAMRLRSLKRDLRRCCESQDDYPPSPPMAMPGARSGERSTRGGAHPAATGFIPFRADLGGSWAELNGGISAQLTRTTSIYANASYQVGLDGRSDAWDAKAGVRVNW
jgi:hypothetical protein